MPPPSPPLKAKLGHHFFLAKEKALSLLSFKQSMRILFPSSKGDWNQIIAHGFRKTLHQVEFKELDPDIFSEYDLIVPFTINDLRHLSTVRELLKDNPIPIPSMESLELCDDKIDFNQRMIDEGFGDYIPQTGQGLSYPYILKKNIDGWGANCFVITNAEEEQNYTELLGHPEYFCQKALIGNSEYATHMVIRNGKLVCSLNIEYTFENTIPVKGKEEYLYTKFCPCPYLELFTRMLCRIGFEGLCCVNYKMEGDHPYLFEINPRFGGSLCSFFFSIIRHL